MAELITHLDPGNSIPLAISAPPFIAEKYESIANGPPGQGGLWNGLKKPECWDAVEMVKYSAPESDI